MGLLLRRAHTHKTQKLLLLELTTKRWSRPLAAAGFRTCRTSANMIACHTVVLSPQIHHSHRNICRAVTQRGQKGSSGHAGPMAGFFCTHSSLTHRQQTILRVMIWCQAFNSASPCRRRAQLAVEHSCTEQTGAACSGPGLLRGRLSRSQS